MDEDAIFRLVITTANGEELEFGEGLFYKYRYNVITDSYILTYGFYTDKDLEYFADLRNEKGLQNELKSVVVYMESTNDDGQAVESVILNSTKIKYIVRIFQSNENYMYFEFRDTASFQATSGNMSSSSDQIGIN